MRTKELQHLYWRAGFGLDIKLLKLTNKNRKEIVDTLIHKSQSNSTLNVDISFLNGVNPGDLMKNPSKAREINRLHRKKILELNYTWIKQLFNPKEDLRERMTLFWANHFVCKDQSVVHVQKYNNTLRTHALGDFRTFVKAISKEASMLKYLNGKQNRKHRPNENFARELMELFTLGEGKYSENDIKESARAFTGYNHDYKGNFIFRERQHDSGQKTFLNKTGNFDGDEIIDIILSNKQCARYISDKVYRYFVNPAPNKKHIEDMAEVFFKDYNIENLMRYVFMSDWFYKEENIGAKIKSPIDLLVGIVNTVPVKFENRKDLIKIQSILGQTLLDPPNVAGWQGNKGWIDANTIMVRLKLPSLLLNNANISLKEEGDFNDRFRERYFKKIKGKLPFKTTPDWTVFSKNFRNISSHDLGKYIIQTQIDKGTASYLKSLSKSSKKEYCVQLMSLPEYQMC